VTTSQVGLSQYATVVIGYVTSNPSGSVTKTLDYQATTLPRVCSNLNVEVYTDHSGQLGSGIVSTQVTKAGCLPTGLKP
jgi:hypothetical protein